MNFFDNNKNNKRNECDENPFLNVLRSIQEEIDQHKQRANLFTGRPPRELIIQKEEINDLIINLNTTTDVNEFLATI